MNKLTLKETARRISQGEIVQVAIKEHIDLWNSTFDPSLFELEPDLTGDPYVDAWLAAAAHYEAFLIGRDPEAWTNTPSRYLSEPQFPKGKNARVIALVETPFPFRMRMVFCGKTTLKAPAN